MSVRKRALSFDHAPRPHPNLAPKPIVNIGRMYSPVLVKRKTENNELNAHKRQKKDEMNSLVEDFKGLGKRNRNKMEPVRRQRRRYKEELAQVSRDKQKIFDRVKLLHIQLKQCRKINDSRKAQIISDRNLAKHKLHEMRQRQILLENRIKQLEKSNKWYRAHMAQQNRPHSISIIG